MPEVGYDKTPVRKELKTAPPDGYVMLRRLPYNEILARREMATKLSMEQTSNSRRARGPRDKREPREETQRIGIELAQVVTREYEFANCITDHNLEVDGVKVDFSKPKLAFMVVDPRILSEIELHLSDLNMEVDDDELEDFTTAPAPASRCK